VLWFFAHISAYTTHFRLCSHWGQTCTSFKIYVFLTLFFLFFHMGGRVDCSLYKTWVNVSHTKEKQARIGQWYSIGIGLWAGWSVVRVLEGARNSSLHHCIKTGSGTHPASYPMDTRGSFFVGKASGEWIFPQVTVAEKQRSLINSLPRNVSTTFQNNYKQLLNLEIFEIL
jgi:hypothetical protein